VTHADGTLVDAQKPAKVGETIAIYAVGFQPVARTGFPATVPVQLASAGTGVGSLMFSYLKASSRTGAYIPVDRFIEPEWVGATPGFVGLYQINTTVPPMPAETASCADEVSGTNTSIRGLTTSAGPIYICVAP
jgi:uncharacterized protein (TIGR03437 family)